MAVEKKIAIKDQTEDASTLDSFSLEMFEDLAFVMWSAALQMRSTIARMNGSISSTPSAFIRSSRS